MEEGALGAFFHLILLFLDRDVDGLVRNDLVQQIQVLVAQGHGLYAGTREADA